MALDFTNELARLDSDDQSQWGLSEAFTIEYLVYTDVRVPVDLLSRVRTVLAAAIDRGRAMPEWFVTAAEKNADWDLDGFLYWFEYEMRSWWWWRGVVVDPTVSVIQIETHGFPYADGALQFLLEAAGATRVVRDIDVTS